VDDFEIPKRPVWTLRRALAGPAKISLTGVTAFGPGFV
jgi:hypothetical protein